MTVVLREGKVRWQEGDLSPRADLEALRLIFHFAPADRHGYLSTLIHGQWITAEPDDEGLRELHVVPLTVNNPHAENGLPIPTSLSLAGLEGGHVSIAGHSSCSTEGGIETRAWPFWLLTLLMQ